MALAGEDMMAQLCWMDLIKRAVSTLVTSRLTSGEYACSLAAVRKLLKDQRNVRYYPGLFPSTAGR
jgi:hypothetical protein